jgi:hypothetical protein
MWVVGLERLWLRLVVGVLRLVRVVHRVEVGKEEREMKIERGGREVGRVGGGVRRVVEWSLGREQVVVTVEERGRVSRHRRQEGNEGKKEKGSLQRELRVSWECEAVLSELVVLVSSCVCVNRDERERGRRDSLLLERLGFELIFISPDADHSFSLLAIDSNEKSQRLQQHTDAFDNNLRIVFNRREVPSFLHPFSASFPSLPSLRLLLLRPVYSALLQSDSTVDSSQRQRGREGRRQGQRRGRRRRKRLK